MPVLDSDSLAALARQMNAEQSVDDLWRRVVDAALAQIEGAAHAGITIVGKTSVSTPVASDQLVIAEKLIATEPIVTARREQGEDCDCLPAHRGRHQRFADFNASG